MGSSCWYWQAYTRSVISDITEGGMESTATVDEVSGRIYGVWNTCGGFEAIIELVPGFYPHFPLYGAFPFPGSPLDLFLLLRRHHPAGRFARGGHRAHRRTRGCGHWRTP